MPQLTEYLNQQTLRQLQDAFSAVAGCPIRICDLDGVPQLPTGDDPDVGELAMDVPVKLGKRIVGRLRMYRHVTPKTRAAHTILEPFQKNLLTLMGNILARLGKETMLRRSRIQQIMAMHRVMASFSGQQQSLQDVLDKVTQMVVKALNAKACAIRLVTADGKELAVQAVHSISRQYLDKKPIPISMSPLDQEVLASSGKPVYVADMPTDPRVTFREEALKEGLASGLCAAMVYKEKPLGVLRVFSSVPYEFDWFERQMLQTIANAAAAAIANARLAKEAVKSWRMKRQLGMAGEVQRRMIPQKNPTIEGVEIESIYVPNSNLAGDFYDFLELPESNTGIAICDVVGKGVRASLLMASIRASLRAHASNLYDISEVMDKVNADLCAGTVSSDFATMFYGVLQNKTHRLTYTCAGHPPPMLVRDGEVIHLECRGGVIGIIPEMDFPVDFIDLQPGDVLLAYTDGLSEAPNFAFEEYGVERIEVALKDAVKQGFGAKAIARYCVWDMRRFAGLQKRHDDLTLLVIKVKDAAKGQPALLKAE